MITKEAIEARLAKIRDSRARGDNRAPADYRDFLPETLGIEPQDPSLAFMNLNNIEQQGKNATNIVRVQQQNLREAQEAQRAAQDLERAKKLLQQTSRPIKLDQKRGARVNLEQTPVAAPASRKYSKNRWGQDRVPEVSDLQRVRPNAPIVNVQWRGHSFNVNRQVAPIFVAFLDDLWAQGYRPVSIGGHNERNIAGTNTPSLHADGLAIDIDPNLNPVQDNDGFMQTALPPNIRALAARYGLAWGGSWNSYKDPMHFSVPQGGRE